MNASDYFYRDKEGREIGPFSLDTLAKFRMAEVVGSETPVRSADSMVWKPLGEVIQGGSAATNPLGAKPEQSEGNSTKQNLPVGILIAAAIIAVLLFNGRDGKKSDLQGNGQNGGEVAKTEIDTVKRQYACIDNLKRIDGAKQQWAIEARQAATAVPTDSDIYGPTLYIRAKPICPTGGVYFMRSVQQSPTCSAPGHSLELSGTEQKRLDEGLAAINEQINPVQKKHVHKNTCIANLRQIDGAKQQWAVEAKQSARAVPADSDIYGGSLYIRAKPLCPLGGQYDLHAVSVSPTCTIAGHTL